MTRGGGHTSMTTAMAPSMGSRTSNNSWWFLCLWLTSCDNYVYEQEISARGIGDLPDEINGDGGLSDQLTQLRAELADLETRLGGEKAAYDNLGLVGKAIRVEETPEGGAVITIDPTNFPGGVTIRVQPNPADASSMLVVSPDEGVSMEGLDLAIELADLTVEGGNVQIRNASAYTSGGAGTTDSTPDGTGNLIVGWNESVGGEVRTGSHNVILGVQHSYTSYGALITGEGNSASGSWAVLLGGSSNSVASAGGVSIGGQQNEIFSSATGGVSVGGQTGDVVNGDAVLVGGVGNTASGIASVVVAGQQGTAAGDYSLAGGGTLATSSGQSAAVIGGYNVTVGGADATGVCGTNVTRSEERGCWVNDVEVEP